MEMRKIGLALGLTASFGLIACGGDSGSSAGDQDTAQCSVIKNGKTVGFEYEVSGIYAKFTYTDNGDGTISFNIKETLPSSVSDSELKDECEKIKKDHEDFEFETLECKDGKITAKATFDAGSDSANLLEQMSSLSETTCQGIENASENNSKSSSSTKGSKNSSASKDDKSSSSAIPSGNLGSDKDYFADDSRYCKFKKKDNTWVYGDFIIEWKDESSYYETNYNASSFYEVENEKDCQKIASSMKYLMEEEKGEEAYCNGSQLITKYLYTDENRDDVFDRAYNGMYCRDVRDAEENNSNVSDENDDIESSSSSKGSKNSSSSTEEISFDTLPDCSSDNEGETYDYLGMVTMVCKDGQWGVEGVEISGDCTEENEGEEGKLYGVDVVCRDGNWDPLPCTDGEKKDVTSMGYTASMVCVDGQWENDKCTDGDTKSGTVAGIPMDMICVDGTWEEKECTDGDTKSGTFITIQMEFVCADGKWTTDLFSNDDTEEED